MLWGDIVAVFLYLKGDYKQEENQLFTVVVSDRTSWMFLNYSRGDLGWMFVSEKFFTERVVRDWYKLPRKVFEPGLDEVLGNLIWWVATLPMAGGLELYDFWNPFPHKPFNDSMSMYTNIFLSLQTQLRWGIWGKWKPSLMASDNCLYFQRVVIQYARTAPKGMPPILWCWSMKPDADVGGMVEKVEPSYQYSITFCCHVTDGNRGAVWQKRCLTWKFTWSKGVPLNSSVKKKNAPIDIHWCLLNRTVETKQWMWAQWGSGWCFIGVATATVGYLCWCRFLWAWQVGFSSLLVKMHR